MPKTSEKTAPKPVAVKALAKGDHVFLVDGSSYIFRAYHALPPLNRKSDGLQVNAVLGFCNMLWKLLRDMPPDNRPTHLAIVFDKSEITFRNKLYPDYKAHRPPAPDELIPQFALIREAVRAFDLPCLEQAGFEADDLIATYVREACERGATATIVSSDKDLMQLVTDCVTMYDTMKDRRIGIAEVIEKFGVPPEKVVEVQALAGDSTDNVPGVPGIGVKTAAQLIVEYGDLETLLQRAGEIKQPKRREALIENAEKARISRQLVLLDDKVKLDVPLDELAVHEPDARKLIAFLKAMEFSTLTRRVAEYSQINPSDVEADSKNSSGASGRSAGSSPPPVRAAGGDLFAGQEAPTSPAGGKANTPGKAQGDRQDTAAGLKGTPISLAAARAEAARKTPVDRAKYQTVRSLEQLKAWLARARDIGHFAIDAKANSIDPMQAEMCGIALALDPNDACYIPLGHKQSGDGAGLFDAGLAPGQIRTSDALDELRPLLESAGILKIGFNIKFNAVMLAQHGVSIRNQDDAQLMSYALDAGRNSHALDALSERWLGHAIISHGDLTGSGKAKLSFDQVAIDRATAYSAEDADVILRLWRVLKPRLAAERMTAVYETLERPLIPVLATNGTARHLDRPPGAVAAVGRIRPDRRARRGRNPGNRRRADQCRQPQAARRYHFRQDGIARRLKNQDRRVVDLGAGARRARRTGPCIPEEDSGMAAGLEAEVDLYRCAADLCASANPSRPHHLRAGGDHHRPAVVERAEPAEHPGAHRGRPQDPPRLHRLPRTQAGVGGLFADRTAAAGGNRRHSRAQAGVPRRPRHSRHDRVGNVRRADQGHAGRGAAPRQSDQFRHHLRHLGVWIGQPARDSRARKPPPISRNISNASPASAPTWIRRGISAASHGYVETLFGRKCHYPDIKASNASVRSFNERAAINARLQGTAADIIRRAMIRMEDALAGKEALGADAAAGARRTDLRGARRRGGGDACRWCSTPCRTRRSRRCCSRCRCRSMHGRRTIGTRRINSSAVNATSPRLRREQRRPPAAVLGEERQCFALAIAQRRVRGYRTPTMQSICGSKSPSLQPSPRKSGAREKKTAVAARKWTA